MSDKKKPGRGSGREADTNYEIGYGKPPEQTRFAPGQSGNPKGRPRGSRNLSTVVGELARQTMTITEGGRPRRVPRYTALNLILWGKALKGDHKAFMAIHQSMRDVGLLRPEVEVPQTDITQDDQLIIQDYFSRTGGTLAKTSKSHKKAKKEP
jgi:hypothetical protein